MDLNSIPLMAALKRRMAWLSQNQSVLSQNVANADTPGYKAKELGKQDFSKLVDELQGGSTKPAMSLRTNSARHLNTDGGLVGGAGAGKVDEVEDSEESLTGNSVVLEEEMLKVANNQMEYGLVVNLYKKNIGLLKMALGKRA